MFGMGFFEILVVIAVAVIALGPDKLPKAMVDLAKFIRAAKKTLEDAKNAVEREVNLEKIKAEANEYKRAFSAEYNELSKDIELKNFDKLQNDYREPWERIENKDSAKNQVSVFAQNAGIAAEVNSNTDSNENSNLNENKNSQNGFGAGIDKAVRAAQDSIESNSQKAANAMPHAESDSIESSAAIESKNIESKNIAKNIESAQTQNSVQISQNAAPLGFGGTKIPNTNLAADSIESSANTEPNEIESISIKSKKAQNA